MSSWNGSCLRGCYGGRFFAFFGNFTSFQYFLRFVEESEPDSVERANYRKSSVGKRQMFSRQDLGIIVGIVGTLVAAYGTGYAIGGNRSAMIAIGVSVAAIFLLSGGYFVTAKLFGKLFSNHLQGVVSEIFKDGLILSYMWSQRIKDAKVMAETAKEMRDFFSLAERVMRPNKEKN